MDNNEIIDVTKQEEVVPKKNVSTSKRPVHVRTLNLFVGPLKRAHEKYSSHPSRKIVDTLLVAVIVLLCLLTFVLAFKKINVPFVDLILGRPTATKANLEINLNLNNKNNPVAELGEKLSYILNIKNNSSAPASNLEVKLKISGAAVEEKSVASKAKLTDGFLVWTPAENEGLKNLAPGEEISLDFGFSVSKKITVANPVISVTATISGTTDGRSFVLDSPESRVKILSDLSLIPGYGYFTTEGDQIGAGEWPPKVDGETTLRVFLNIKNNLNVVKDAKVSAKLPVGIFWVGRIAVNSGAAIEFNPDTNEISWSAGTVSPTNNATASFEVRFAPSASDLNKTIKLLENIKIIGQDSFAGAEIQAQIPSFSTTERVVDK